MVKTQHIDKELLDDAIRESGLKPGFIVETLGISRQAFNRKRRGVTAFRKSEIYVLCDLLRIIDSDRQKKIFGL